MSFDIPPFTPPADRPIDPPAVARPATEAPAAAPVPAPAAAAEPPVSAPVSAPAPVESPAAVTVPDPAPAQVSAVAAADDGPPLIDVRLAEPEPPAEAPAPAVAPLIDVALAVPAPAPPAADPVPALLPHPEAAPTPTPPALHEAAPHAEAETAYIAHTTAHAEQGPDEHASGPIDVSVEMFFWTLGTFLLMAWLLTKLAWRPILGALDKREEELRQAVDNAEQVRVELDTIEEKRHHIILDADTKAKEIVDRARVAGREAGRVLTEKAKQEATIIQENTQREINTAREKAAADLRQESVDRALELTEKFLEQKMTPAQQRKLTERLIDQI